MLKFKADIEFRFLIVGKIIPILIDFQRRGEERDEDGGEKTPTNCLTKEHQVVFLESAESSVIVISSIGIVRGDPFYRGFGVGDRSLSSAVRQKIVTCRAGNIALGSCLISCISHSLISKSAK